jgi:hypothetical protein
MSQFDSSPFDDIFKKAESGASPDSQTPPRTDAPPTQEDVLAEIREKCEPWQNNLPVGSADTTFSIPTATEYVSEADEAPEKVDDGAAPIEAPETLAYEPETAPTIPISPALPTGNWSAFQATIGNVEQNVRVLADSSVKITGEIREMHKLYHNEYASRLKSMQDELERYREIDKGRIFDGILGEVAKLYSDYESLVDDVAEEKLKKRIRYMLDDIVQILQANGVLKQKSKPGDKRNTRHCLVIERIPTANQELHDTVSKSRGTGFYIENRSLIKEPVDIYLYSETAEDKSAQI